MDEIIEVLKAVNEALAHKEMQIKWAREDKEKTEAKLAEALSEVGALKEEIENLRGDLEFYKPKGVENK